MSHSLLLVVLLCACGGPDKTDDSAPPDDTAVTPNDLDGDGYTSDIDCDDDDPSVHPDADEICYDDADNDCDGDTDEDCAYPDDYPLEGADAVLYGSTEGGLAGYAVSSAGDVNGDGYDDLLIGAPEAAWEGTELDGHYETGRGTGAAMVVLGPAIGELDLTEADAWVQGSNTEDEYWSDTGWSVAGVGDTNGDGFDDLLIGAPDYFTYTEWWDGERVGMAALFLGPVSGIDHLQNADAAWYMGGYDSHTGYDVARAGDIDGDGLADILIGSPGGDLAHENGGEVYVFSGPITGELESTDLHALIYGAGAGTVTSSAGDVNGDGLDDILVGSAHLLLAPLEGSVSLEDASLTIQSSAGVSQVGQALSDAGDLDGDGYGDFVLGQRYADTAETAAGLASVFYGDADGGGTGTVDLSSAAATLGGTEYYEMAAASVSGVDDTDGDGRSELLVGTGYYHIDQETEGTTWLVHGPIVGSYDLDDVAATRFMGINSGDHAGAAVSSAGDVDADGLSDILIGAPGDDTYGDNAGAAYLILAAGL